MEKRELVKEYLKTTRNQTIVFGENIFTVYSTLTSPQ